MLPILKPNTEAALAQSKLYHAGKRALDITLSLLALVLLSPVCALVAGLIKLDSAGPVFFRQTRLGLGGKPFTFYKFRTMQHNCDNNVHQNYVQALIRNEVGDDASVTPGWRLQTGAGQAHHARRGNTAQDQPGRNPSVVQRTERRDEPGWAQASPAL